MTSCSRAKILTVSCLLGLTAAAGCDSGSGGGASSPRDDAAAGGAGGANAPASGGAGGRGGAGAAGGAAATGGGAGSGGAGGGTGGGSGGGRADAGAPDARPAGGDARGPDGGGAGIDMGAPAGSLPAPGDYGTRASLLEPNSEMAVAADGGKIYVLGGYPASRQTQSTLQVYDVATNKWTLGKPLPMRVHHPVLVGVGGKLYSLGGQTDPGDANSNRTFEYDPTKDDWAEKMTMPTARGGGAGAAIGSKIYVVGGRPPAANAFEVYDVGTNRWEMLPKLPSDVNNRNHLAAAAIGGKIYVAGGRYNGGGFMDPMTNRLDMFDPVAGTWTQKQSMLRPRGGVSGVVAFGCFHVFGGEGANTGEKNDVFPDHDVYDPRTDMWKPAKKLAIPFHGVTGGAFVDGLIYMPGGGIRSGGTSGTLMHQVFRPDTRCE